MIATCYRSGQIVLTSRTEPEGTITIATAPANILKKAVAGTARLAYDNKTWLVPGIPEASSESQAYQAMLRYEKSLRRVIDKLSKELWSRSAIRQRSK